MGMGEAKPGTPVQQAPQQMNTGYNQVNAAPAQMTGGDVLARMFNPTAYQATPMKVGAQPGQPGSYKYVPPAMQNSFAGLQQGMDPNSNPNSPAYVNAVPPGAYRNMLPPAQNPPGRLHQGLDVYGDPNSAAYVNAQPRAPKAQGWSQNAFTQGLGSLGGGSQ